LLFFTKRIGIALFICPPAFRAARQLAPIGAIFSSTFHYSANEQGIPCRYHTMIGAGRTLPLLHQLQITKKRMLLLCLPLIIPLA
jgi:hypothetical protein